MYLQISIKCVLSFYYNLILVTGTDAKSRQKQIDESSPVPSGKKVRIKFEGDISRQPIEKSTSPKLEKNASYGRKSFFKNI